MKKQYKAFSLLEAILIAAFLGVFAIIAVPRLNFAVVSKHKADSTAKKIVTDLRLTRSLAISEAATNSKGYDLEMTGSAPYQGYEIKNNDTKDVVASYVIDSKITCTGDNKFGFGPLGNLTDSGHTQLTVSSEDRSFTISITPATGMIKCVEN